MTWTERSLDEFWALSPAQARAVIYGYVAKARARSGKARPQVQKGTIDTFLGMFRLRRDQVRSGEQVRV